MYNVINKETGKIYNEEELSMQMALDLYDSLGGSVNGWSVVRIEL